MTTLQQKIADYLKEKCLAYAPRHAEIYAVEIERMVREEIAEQPCTNNNDWPKYYWDDDIDRVYRVTQNKVDYWNACGSGSWCTWIEPIGSGRMEIMERLNPITEMEARSLSVFYESRRA